MKDAFKLVIQLGNDAMQTGEDIASALRKVADHIDAPQVITGTMAIYDANGNRVGLWEAL